MVLIAPIRFDIVSGLTYWKACSFSGMVTFNPPNPSASAPFMALFCILFPNIEGVVDAVKSKLFEGYVMHNGRERVFYGTSYNSVYLG